MRIDQLTIQNFRKFEALTFNLHPKFNLLVGANGAGKTTILEALSKALNVWSQIPDQGFFVSKDLTPDDALLAPTVNGDRIQFQPHFPIRVQATGKIVENDELTTWGQICDQDGCRWISQLTNQDVSPANLPVLAYYGVSRAVVPERKAGSALRNKPQKWDAYKHWLEPKIHYDDILNWFFRETAAAGANKGQFRPGYEAVRQAVFNCLPTASDLWFDVDREDLICSVNGQTQPLRNLSDGQRVLLAMTADIAIKAITLNAHLLSPGILFPEDKPLPRVLKETPGVVLIDELDLHLHPSWQRRVAADLKRTFPSIQFIATSHSPQIIGELEREEIRLLKDDRVELPPVARGADSNWILDHVMENSASENQTARELKDDAEEALAEGDLPTAHKKLEAFRDLLDGETGDLIRLESSLATLEALEGVGV